EEGERLRRFQSSGQRSLLRTLETLLKIRRSGVVPVIPGEGEPAVSAGRNEPAGEPSGSEFGLARTVLDGPLTRPPLMEREWELGRDWAPAESASLVAVP